MSFRLKTILGIALIESVLLGVLIWSSLGFLADANARRLTEYARTTVTLFATTTKNAVLAYDLASLESFVEEVLRNPELVYARVIADDIVLAEGGDPAALARPFQADDVLEGVTDAVFDTAAGISAGGRQYGRVEIGISTDDVDALMATARQRVFTLAGIEILLTALFSLALGVYLTRQLRDLRDASQRLAAGELDYRVPVRGRDELAQTAAAFNAMTATLQVKEQELIDAREQAEAANAAKTDFLARMSHELRTPMNAMLGFAQLMECDPDEPPGPGQRDSIAEILKAGDHLLHLINDVLDLARIEGGGLSVSLEPVELRELVTDTLSLLRTTAAARDIRLHPPSAGAVCQAIADRVRVQQILLNLVSNAIKYNRPGGDVWVELAQGRAGRCVLSVTDTGAGLTAEQQAEVFQPFVRYHDDSIPGAGVGLSVSRRLAQVMRGELSVATAPCGGCRFALELPAAPALAVPAEAPAPAGLPAAAAGPVQRLLYVEDNPANQRLVQRLLDQHWPDTELIVVPSAELGLDLARHDPPALILMDINLPGLDGLDALQRLRKDPATRAVPVAALTANALPTQIEKGLAAGFDAYLTKPLQVEALTRTLRTLLP